MATDLYSSISNPVSGETFRCIEITPESYKMHWTLQAHGYVPFEHVHYAQEEVFEVQKGELKVCINGIDHIAGPGETITVPMGMRHIASNNKAEQMDAIVSYRPALDQETFFKCFCGLTMDRFLNNKGGVSIPMMGYLLVKMKCKAMARPTNIPAPAFKMALVVFYLMGMLKGWRKLYVKYTS